MKVKIFTVNENGYILITKEELQELVNEAYEEGRNTTIATPTITYPQTPYYTWSNPNSPFQYTLTCNGMTIKDNSYE